MYVKIKKIPPKRILCIEVAIQIASNAYLSKECAIQVDLYYKKKLIRYRQEVIQPSFQPSYDPQAPPADVLLVISKDFTTTEFQFWEHIFDLLGVSADYWDIHKHNGFSVDLKTGVRHKDSWIGRYSGKLVLYPHGVLKLLHAKDIAIHFHGEDISTTQLQDLGSSMVVFGAKKITYQEKKNLVKQLALTTPKITLPIPDIHRSHLCQPSTAIVQREFTAWESSCIKGAENEAPSQSPVVLKKEVGARSVGFCQYSYGSLDIHRVPLLRSSHFLHISKASDIIAMAVTGFKPKATKIFLTTCHGQVLLGTLFGIPMSAKLKLLKSKGKSYTFCIPNKLTLSCNELALIAISWDIAEELYSFSGDCIRAKQLYEDIRDNSSAYTEKTHIISAGVRRIFWDVKKHAAKIESTATTAAVQVINTFLKKISNIISTDFESPELPSMEILLCQPFLYRCHQHLVDAGEWDLT